MSKTAKILAGVGVATGVIAALWYVLRPPTLPECDATHPCPEGFICVDGVCVPEVAPPDVEVMLSWD